MIRLLMEAFIYKHQYYYFRLCVSILSLVYTEWCDYKKWWLPLKISGFKAEIMIFWKIPGISEYSIFWILRFKCVAMTLGSIANANDVDFLWLMQSENPLMVISFKSAPWAGFRNHDFEGDIVCKTSHKREIMMELCKIAFIILEINKVDSKICESFTQRPCFSDSYHWFWLRPGIDSSSVT